MNKQAKTQNLHKILVLNGPNLNLLGKRESNIYPKESLKDIEKNLKSIALENDLEIEFKQSNAEHELVNEIQKALETNVKYILINAAAYTHTSIAIRDALLAVEIPFIELHISNIYKREEFRQKSLLADISRGVIVGFGSNSYLIALGAAILELVKK